MMNKIYGSIGIILFFAIPIFLMGCASEPVIIDWPANHPANPETQEAEFIPPKNPFQMDMAVMKEEPGNDPMMKHQPPMDSDMQHMDHNTGTDKKDHSDSESKMKPDHKGSDNQHKGHSQ